MAEVVNLREQKVNELAKQVAEAQKHFQDELDKQNQALQKKKEEVQEKSKRRGSSLTA